MNEDDLRIKIYEHLGLDVGSLSSESGNDWMRAKKEVQDEYRKEQAEKNSTTVNMNYQLINKLNQEFIDMINSNSVKDQSYQCEIAMRNDLSENDIILLIQKGSKETIMNLVRHQTLSDEHKEKLIYHMRKFNNAYTDLIQMIS